MALTQVTSNGLKDDSIVNADIKSDAAIAGSKLAADSIAEEKLDISNSASDGQYLQYKDSSDKLTWATLSSVGGATGVDFNDDVKIRSGTGNDLEIYFDGSNGIINNANETLHVMHGAEVQAKFIVDGAVELYTDGTKRFETTSIGGHVLGYSVNTDVGYAASQVFEINNSSDANNNHTALSFTFAAQDRGAAIYAAYRNTAGEADLILAPEYNEKAAVFKPHAECELYYDNVCNFKTASYGTLQNNGNFRLADGTDADAGWGRIQWGASQDLEIYHNATDSIIKNSTNSLKLDSGRTILRNLSNGDPMVDCTGGGTVELFHNGSKKLETTSAGGTLTGTWTGAGKVLQVVQTVKTDTWSEDLSNATYGSVVSGLTVDITPSSASNKVLVQVVVAVSQEHSDRVGVSLTRGGSVIVASLGAGTGNRIGVGSTSGVASSTQAGSTPITYLDSPSSTSSQTYGIKVMQGTGGTSEVYVNAQATGDSAEANRFRYSSTITAMEISS